MTTKPATRVLNLCAYTANLSLDTLRYDLAHLIATNNAQSASAMYEFILDRITQDQAILRRLILCEHITRFGSSVIASAPINTDEPIGILPARLVDANTVDIKVNAHFLVGCNRDECKASIHRAVTAKIVYTKSEANCEFVCLYGILVVLMTIKNIPRGGELYIYIE